ncbi:hypothetical protein FB567DRAFT_326537 [Paraphoma chrysanthemicola]|uniref:Uncharacterized protein n=1 Tax=Paraphoma chrysanthemicola TaxID=798071 RepID=A0A8K0VZK0_9PLEO|nr:hypothetical protein FB567DRAFT_326537 [Paraphoma chrysanthemicola]
MHSELHLQQTPTGVIAVQQGHTTRLVRDDVAATTPQTSTSHRMLAFQPEASKPPDPAPATATRRRGHGVTLLTAVDPGNIIDLTENVVGDPGVEDALTSSLSASKYAFRNRRANHSKLAYDVKYHPMDDDIQPTRAAKRRMAHGETQSILVDASGSCSENNEEDTDEDNDAANSTDEERAVAQSKSRKRRRCENWPLEPPRRSLRKTSEAKVLYDMSIHPQDEELEMLTMELDSENEDEDEENVGNDSSSIFEQHPGFIGGETTAELDADTTNPRPDCTTADRSVKAATEMQSETEALVAAMSPSSSTAATPPRHSVRRREGLDVWLLEPGERYFRHDRESWVPSPSLPFSIHPERLEDQLAADANAASPYNFDHDDKENDVANCTSEQASNLGMMSIMPASQYKRTREESQASCERSMVDGALYDIDHSRSPYGLGGNDGTHEPYEPGIGGTFLNDCLRVLVSGEQLPRGADS